MNEMARQIEAVERHVGTRALTDGEARTASVAQSYDATLDDVWDACTSAERIPRWLMPVTGDLRLRGRYQLEGNAGGTIETCDPPNGFTATWEYAEEVSWIEVRLTAETPSRTRVEVVHIAHVDDDRWGQFGPAAVGIGWDMMLLGLASHLGSGAAVVPAEAMAWLVSAEGVDFASRSGDAWYAADVDSGADPTTARAAADRTTAAYTGTDADAEPAHAS